MYIREVKVDQGESVTTCSHTGELTGGGGGAGIRIRNGWHQINKWWGGNSIVFALERYTKRPSLGY